MRHALVIAVILSLASASQAATLVETADPAPDVEKHPFDAVLWQVATPLNGAKSVLWPSLHMGFSEQQSDGAGVLTRAAAAREGFSPFARPGFPPGVFPIDFRAKPDRPRRGPPAKDLDRIYQLPAPASLLGMSMFLILPLIRGKQRNAQRRAAYRRFGPAAAV